MLRSSDHLQITYKKKTKLNVIVSLRETGTDTGGKNVSRNLQSYPCLRLNIQFLQKTVIHKYNKNFSDRQMLI